MNKPRFQVRIVGVGVAPETVKLGDLAGFLIEIEKAILAASNLPEQQRENEAVVSLVRIEHGSNQLTISIEPAAVDAVRTLAHAVAVREFGRLPFASQEALHSISKKVIRRNWSFEFVPNRELGIEPGTISEGAEVPPPEVPVITGTTTIVGRLLRVGGAGEPKALLRLTNGDLLHLSVSEGMAKLLAPRLYDPVCLEGQAVWRSSDLKLEEFKAAAMIDFKPGSLADSFRHVAEASPGAWQGEDAADFVRRLRSEE